MREKEKHQSYTNFPRKKAKKMTLSIPFMKLV